MASCKNRKPSLRLWWPRQITTTAAPVYLLGKIFENKRNPSCASSYEVVVVCACPSHLLADEANPRPLESLSVIGELHSKSFESMPVKPALQLLHATTEAESHLGSLVIVIDAKPHSEMGMLHFPVVRYCNADLVRPIQVVFYDRPVLGGHFYSLKMNPIPLNTDVSPQAPLDSSRQATILDPVLTCINASPASQTLIASLLSKSGPIKSKQEKPEPRSWMQPRLTRLGSLGLHLYLNRASKCVKMLATILTMLSFGFSCALFWVLEEAALFCSHRIPLLAQLGIDNSQNAILQRCHAFFAWAKASAFSKSRQIQAPFSTNNISSTHSARLRTHSLWTSLAVDTALGAYLSLHLFLHIHTLPLSLQTLTLTLRDDVLRSGVVFLLHKPGGLKLNTELANAFATLAWQGIEAGSEVGRGVAPYLGLGFRALGVLGPLIGVSGSLGVVADCLVVATWQLRGLHGGVAWVYKWQLRIITALWRLFMSRKWNPLQQRPDSFSCSVDQLVVASLLFATTLLLFPTTAIFYLLTAILTAILTAAASLLRLAITAVHNTPTLALVLWGTRPKRFPAGLLFVPVGGGEGGVVGGRGDGKWGGDGGGEKEAEDGLMSYVFMDVNPATIGEMMRPFVTHLCQPFTLPAVRASLLAFASGERTCTAPKSSPQSHDWFQKGFKYRFMAHYCDFKAMWEH